MELELGLKITKTRDDHYLTTTNLRITKDRASPLFLSRETGTMFILTAHLKGVRKEKIKIKINEDGTRITISGEKPVQEMVMVGWTMYHKEGEVKVFEKIFRIPDGVVLDRIKAKFNEEESILTIVMPKLVKGVRGVGIEEVKEEEVDRGRLDEVPETETFQQQSKEPEIRDIEEIDRGTERLGEAPEIEGGKEDEQITPAKVEPAATPVTYPEAVIKEQMEVEEERELDRSETKELPPTEESRAEEIDRGTERLGEAPEIEGGKEVEQMTPEKVEPAATSVTYPEAVIKEQMEVEEERELDRSETKELPPTEESRAEEIDRGTERLGEAPEIEGGKEVEQITPKKVEPAATSVTYPEAVIKEQMEVEEERELDWSETKELPPTEESQAEEIHELKEQIKKHEIQEAEKEVPEERSEEYASGPETIEATKFVPDQVIQQSELPKSPLTKQSQVEEEHTTDEITEVESEVQGQESQKQETGREIQEPMEVKPDRTTMPHLEQPADQHNRDQEVHENEETHGIGNEIQEEATDQVKLPEEKVHDSESPEVEKEKQEDLSDQATQMVTPPAKKSKLRAPCIFAGSAFLVSLIAFVIHLIRAKKR